VTVQQLAGGPPQSPLELPFPPLFESCFASSLRLDSLAF
jgi:hypothetical protein